MSQPWVMPTRAMAAMAEAWVELAGTSAKGPPPPPDPDGPAPPVGLPPVGPPPVGPPPPVEPVGPGPGGGSGASDGVAVASGWGAGASAGLPLTVKAMTLTVYSVPATRPPMVQPAPRTATWRLVLQPWSPDFHWTLWPSALAAQFHSTLTAPGRPRAVTPVARLGVGSTLAVTGAVTVLVSVQVCAASSISSLSVASVSKSAPL